ncbi:RrF2 family transcriptional regulator [Clostridium thailandense]|uniref:Rrf2 family transcriptional regulator n=1 Tax=Clostridium thailandense TaxID=2794346 RepID=A0A949U097_9CLOT|nr:Rrf2 family transcriptional regulator [Clostridium thailandense]MBV7274093.1 Rrf2 family transcriptional regulator [Clostridium thailandense]MCH5137683.1 Rrf2 family transcriptional regulator [Clostridiaceae bacterium UIB06]
MKISTKGRYGLKALIDIALYSNSEVVTLKSISERQSISEGYLEQIFSALRKSGLVIGRKGAQGGYTLSKDINTITIGEILRALEGDLSLVNVGNNNASDALDRCINENLWDMINRNINDYFDSVTLEDLVNKYKSEVNNYMYFI